MTALPPIPLLVAAGLAGAVGLFALIVNHKLLKWVLMLMLFCSSCTLLVQLNGSVNRTFLFHLQAYRRELVLGLGIVLAMGVVVHLGALRGAKLGAQSIMLIIIMLYMSAIRLFHYGPTDSIQNVALTLFTMIPLALVVSGSVNSWRDFYSVFRAIPVFALLYIGAVVLQTLRGYGEMTSGASARFCAFTGNPQHAAAIFGPLTGMLIFSLLNEPIKLLRLIWLGTLFGCLICLIATQSRTGLVMAVITSAGVLYQRLGTAILLMPILGLLAAGGLAAANAVGVDLGLERFTSTEDTRTAAWSKLISSAMESPAIGKPMDELSGSENSLLNGFASYGIGMLFILVAFMAVSAVVMLGLFMNRSRVPREHRQIVDVIMGYNAAYFAGAMLEGYMISRIATTVIFIHIFAAMGTKVLKLAKAEPVHGYAPPAGPEDWQHEWANPDQLVYTEQYTR